MSDGWDARELLQPIAADRPCGEDLEDSALLASFDAHRIFGRILRSADTPDPPGTSSAGGKGWEPPDWGALKTSAAEALQTSKDLRLLATLAAALLRTDGLPAFLTAVGVASQWLEQDWDGVYPRLDEGDAVFRRNALNRFGDPMAVVDRVSRQPIADGGPHGRISLRDVEIAAGHQPGREDDPEYSDAQIEAAFAAVPGETLAAFRDRVVGGLASVRRIESIMRERGGPEAAPELDALTKALRRIHDIVTAHLPVADGAAGDGVPAAAGGGVAQVAVGAIASRQDAARALDAVAEFFRRNEPSSPVPLLLARAKRLMSMGFLELLGDIAPGGLSEARSVTGVPESE